MSRLFRITLLATVFSFFAIGQSFACGYNGNGIYVRCYNWVNDQRNGINITASRFDTEDNSFANGLSDVITKDGQQTTTGVIPFAQGVRVTIGTPMAPGLSFLGDTTTGIYQGNSGEVDIATSGAEVGTFTGTGLNGTAIGITTPAAGNFTTLSATSITGITAVGKVTLTQPATGSTITVVDGKTLTVDNTLELAGTDGTKITFQGTDTYIGRATTDTLTNKAFDTAGTGNVFKINGTTINSITGTGANVLAVSPALTGTPTAPTASAGTGGPQIATQAYADNSAAVNSGIVLLATVNASGASNVVFNSTYLTSSYKKYFVEFDGVYTSTNGIMTFSISTNNGSSYLLAGYATVWQTLNSSGMSVSVGNSSTLFSLSGNTQTGMSPNVSSGTIKFTNLSTNFNAEWSMVDNFSPTTYYITGAGSNTSTSTVNAIQIAPASGTMTGNFHLYGIKGQ